MVLLAHRERAAQQPREAPPVEWQAQSPPADGHSQTEEWLGIYLNGTKLGYAHNRRGRHGDGYRIQTTSRLQLPLQASSATCKPTPRWRSTPPTACAPSTSRCALTCRRCACKARPSHGHCT